LTKAMVKKAIHRRKMMTKRLLAEEEKAAEVRRDELYKRIFRKPEDEDFRPTAPTKKLRIHVMDEWATLRAVIGGKSISRYGDGELKHMDGRRNVSQVFFESLKDRLTEVFYSNLPNHLVAIPNVWNGRQFTEVPDDYIQSMRRKFYKIADRSRLYASAYITRGDLCGYLSWPSYWACVFEIWRDRDVTLVRGHEKRANTNMMRSSKSIHQIAVPSAHAWRDYSSILSECLDRPKEDLFLICAGPTATVLAYDLAKRDRHAVDLGHLGLFYRRCWGVEDMTDRQVWHHRPSDPGYVKGVTDQC
jgi:hypothetical protein